MKTSADSAGSERVPAQPGTGTLAASEERGSLGVCHLKRLWSRHSLSRDGLRPPEIAWEWPLDKMVLHGLGLSLEETFQYLREKRSYDEFEAWVVECNEGRVEPLRIARLNAALRGDEPPLEIQRWFADVEASAPVLSVEDLSFFDQNGYVVVPSAVPAEACEAAARAIADYLALQLDTPDSWYEKPRQGIMVPLFRHPAFDANRGSRRIHKAFAQLWGTADLWMSVDRGGFNPPVRPGHPFPGPRLHWDVSLVPPIAFDVSGILYLTDTARNQGAFTCVPGFHRKLEAWLESLPPGTDPRGLDLDRLGPVPIEGRAGDLVIWHQALPHGSSPNTAERPRVVQYIAMYPARFEYQPRWR